MCLRRSIQCEAITEAGEAALPSPGDFKSHRLCHQRISPNLFATCRQVYHEAKELVFEQNTFMLTLKNDGPDIQETGESLCLPKHQIMLNAPSRVLKMVKQALVVAEVDAIQNPRDVSYFFERMTSLEGLSIVILTHRAPETCLSPPWIIMQASLYRDILKAILDGVPKNCKISLDPKTEAEQSYIETRKIAKASFYAQNYAGGLVQVMPDILGLYARDILWECHLETQENLTDSSGHDGSGEI